MQISITGQHIDITSAIRDYAEKKLKRIGTMSDKISHVHIVFRIEKLLQIAEANLTLPGAQIHADARSANMYESIDKLVDKITRQIKKYKEKNSGE